MTPLAQAIAKQATLPPHKRKPLFDGKSVLDPAEFISDIHCFECSEVFDLACDLVDTHKMHAVAPDTIFVPAPRTWIEHRDEDGRKGWLLTEHPLRYRIVMEREDRFIVHEYKDFFKKWDEPTHLMAGLIMAMLALVNTPHIIGRREYPPHKGLVRLWQKRFAKKYPLHAWQEIKLSVSKPIEIDDDEPHSAQIGGRRALHFCRAHLRIRLGQLEFVHSHWRGDPALGTKLTRYRVAH